ncbi:MAG: phosphoribosyltransferase [Campylobacterales bacterium]
MLYYSYENFRSDMFTLIDKLDFTPDAILGIARGGLTMAHFLSIALDMREVYSINAVSYQGREQKSDIKIFNIPNLGESKKVLIVDEIIDSGRSMHKIHEVLGEINPDIEFKTAVLFYKKSAVFMPDFYAKEAPDWIDFFWEVDLLSRS